MKKVNKIILSVLILALGMFHSSYAQELNTYNFAAIIYDTDALVNSSFFDYDCTANGTGKPGNGSGILKGLVKNELDANGKMQWQGVSGNANGSCSGANDGWTEANFQKAFKSTPGANVVRCYDMPFARTIDNMWEFDSNKLCSDGSIDLDGTCESTGGKFLGGFFPPELQTRGTADYTQCPNCDKQRPAQGWVDFRKDDINRSLTVISKWCYDRGYLGPASVTGEGLTSAQAATACTRAFTNGDFRNGDNPKDFWDWEGGDGTTGLTARRDGRINGVTGTGDNAKALNNGPVGASGTTTINCPAGSSTSNPGNAECGSGWQNKTMNKNQLFCFESAPAEFTYEKGQDFFFNSDDDMWVFINNKLVLDLGGTALASPGYVDLNKLGLTEGERYPIKIFFCDRRTTMSGIRIKTNLHFSQEVGLSLATADAEIKGDVCLNINGGGSCADVSVGGGTSTRCGTDIMAGLRYYLTNRARTAGEDLSSIGVPGTKGILLDRNSENCVTGNQDGEGESYLLCYGGIRIYENRGKVQVLVDYITGLAETWQVWVTHNEDPHPTMKIAEFTKNVNVQIAGLFTQAAAIGKEICLRETDTSPEPICGAELAQRISYSLVVPEIGSVQLDSAASGCIWITQTQGICYDGIVLNNGVVSINEDVIPDYLKNFGFEIFASVPNYSSLNVSRSEPGQTFIVTNRHRVIQSKEPLYYNLKGEPLGKQKPKRAGVYITHQNGVSKMEVVK